MEQILRVARNFANRISRKGANIAFILDELDQKANLIKEMTEVVLDVHV